MAVVDDGSGDDGGSGDGNSDGSGDGGGSGEQVVDLWCEDMVEVKVLAVM